MAAEPQPNYNAALGAHSGVRQQTRTKVIEILAGNANGCLQELGYTPGLNERLRYLEEMNARLGAVNDDLLKKGKAWQIRAEETQVQAQALKVKCDTFKSENVKLYEDNGKLLGECDTLRTKLATAERLCAIYEQQRGRDGAELLKQYGQLAEQYAAAVRDLQRTNARIAAQPQPQPQASASQPREIRPTVVPTQQPFRRASAPGPQLHSPLAAQSPQIPPTRSHPNMGQTHPNITYRKSSAPLGWQAPQTGQLPPTPTSAPTPGYAYSAAIAAGLPLRRGSTSAGSGSGSVGTPPTFPPTPPMSALPLNLQNFTSPAMQHAPARSASASSSQAQRTPVAVQSPALLSAPASVPPPTPPIPPAVPPDAPPQMQDDAAAPEQQEVGTPPEAHEAITPPPHAPPERPAVLLPSDSLKRGSPDVDGEDPRKRPRTEEVDVKMEVDEDAGRLGDDDEDEEDEEDDGNEVGYIELGPDGLRTIPDCVNAVFDPDEGMVCRFCMARYKQDMEDEVPSEPPQGLAGASVDELAAHCEAEHGFAWSLLRQNV